MSALAATIRFDGTEQAAAAQAAITAMTAAMADCGPDGTAHWVEGSVALGHCSLLATSAASAPQPLVHGPTGIALVMDGYLANWEDLRRDLAASVPDAGSMSDAELVLQAYLRWGTDCARHCDGEYAGLIWDPRRREVHLLRDHHGLRPLYYWCERGRLVAASSLAGVLAGIGQEPPLNIGYLDEVAADVSFTAGDTIWQGISRAKPACVTTVTAERLVAREYWQLPQDVERPFRSIEEYSEAYRAMLGECVRRASRSHRPVAAEVSGGLDSSGVFAVAHDLAAQGRLASPGVAAHSLAGPEGSKSDEIRYARAVAEKCGVPLNEHPLFLPGLGWFADRARHNRDLPPLPNAVMSLHLERAAAAAGSRVLLTGVGGDQWLDGTLGYYRELLAPHYWPLLLRQYQADVKALGARQATRELVVRGPASLIPVTARHFLRDLLRKGRTADGIAAPWLRPESLARLAQREAAYEAGFAADYAKAYKLRKLNYPRWAMLLDGACLQRAQNGLEMRSPMMARAFIEFSATTPEHIRRTGGFGKMVHRRALLDLLPREVARRGSKAEFGVTFDHLDADLRAELPALCSAAGSTLHEDKVRSTIEAYLATDIDERRSGNLWGLYAYSIIQRFEVANREKGFRS